MKTDRKGRKVKTRAKVLLVNPPKKLWPFLPESDNFRPPLAMASLAGTLRDAGIDFRLIDCCGSQIGWRSLAAIISSEMPDIVCAGEITYFSKEVIRLSRLVKRIDDRICFVAGGIHFSYNPEELRNKTIDYIVIGEGEETLPVLIETLWAGKSVSNVRGIAYLKNGKVHKTPMRPPMQDLDNLPMPAWELLPMENYLHRKNSFYPTSIVNIEASRGCVYNCTFCTHSNVFSLNCGPGQGCYRHKTPRRVVDEIKLLQKNFGVDFVFFNDACWNQDPGWCKEFCDLIDTEGIKVRWWGYARADHIIRDHNSGLLRNMVDSGFTISFVGVERHDDRELAKLNKSRVDVKTLEKIYREYPTHTPMYSYIYGIEDEDAESTQAFRKELIALRSMNYSININTPFPGTEYHKELDRKGLIEKRDTYMYDFLNPVARSKKMTIEEIKKGYISILVRAWVSKMGMFLSRKHKRNALGKAVYIFLGYRFGLRFIDKGLHRLIGVKRHLVRPVEPRWYRK